MLFAKSHFYKDNNYEVLKISSIFVYRDNIFQQDGASAHTRALVQQSKNITSAYIFSILN